MKTIKKKATRLVTSVMFLASVSSLAYHPLDTVKDTTEVKAELSFKSKKRAAQQYTNHLYFTASSEDVDESTTYGYKWDKKTLTLTLSGCNIVTAQSPAIELPDGATIYLEKDTENTVTLENGAVNQSTSGGIAAAKNVATVGIHVGDGTKSSTLDVMGYGSLEVNVGHLDNDMTELLVAQYSKAKVRASIGVCGILNIGTGSDSPSLKIACMDDETSFTGSDGTSEYKTKQQGTYSSCGFMLNSGEMHLATGKTDTASVCFSPSVATYTKGRIILESSPEAISNYIFYKAGQNGIINTGGNDITTKDKDGNDLVFNKMIYVDKATGEKAYYVVIDIAKQIAFASKSGGMQVGKAGEININYTTVSEVAGDTVTIESYDSETKTYSTTLPTGMTGTVDMKNKKIKLVTDGTTPEGKYFFRLVITTDEANGSKSFYSSDFDFIVGFEPTGNEYQCDYDLEENDNPTTTNEPITVEATDGYLVSTDGVNFSKSVTYDEESSKTNPKTHASLFIKRIADDSVSEVEFDYSLDTTAPTASIDGHTSYETPSTEKRTNKDVTVSFGDISDSMSDEADIKKEYVVLDSALTEEELKALEKSSELSWNTATSSRTDEEGNPIYDVNVSGNEGDTKVVYVKITDEAGNISYIASDIYVFDMTAPTISGIDEDTDYYVSTGFITSEDATVTYTTSESSTPVTLEKNSDGKYVLPGNVATTYTVTVTDEAGNSSTYTINMNETESIESSISGLTEETVTSDDFDDIQAVLDSIDDLDVSNATDAEKAELESVKENCNKLLNKISDIKKQIEAIDKVKDYSSATVTSSDKSALETIRDNAETLSTSDNLTEVEKANALSDYNTAVELLKKIQDVADDMTSVTTAIGELTTSNVKSSDETALNNALTTISNLTSDENKGNLTAAEQETLASQKEYIENLLSKIASTNEEIKAIDTVKDYSSTTVTSDDKSDLETIRDNALALSTSDNLTEAEKANALSDYNTAVELLKKIQDVADDMKSVTDAIGDLTTDNVTSDDTDSLNSALDTISDLLKTENLTTTEQATLAKQQEYINSLLAKVAEVKKDLDSVTDAIGDFTVDTVTADDKAGLTSAMETIDELLSTSNLTEDEIKTLNAQKETIQALLDKIDEVASDVKSVSDAIGTLTPETVTSDDKAALTTAKETADTLLNGSNLTEEQKTQVEADKATIERLLAEIEKDEAIAEINEAAKGYDIDTVTSADKDDIESIIENIDTVLTDYVDILSEEEKASLEHTKETLNNYLNRINTVEGLYKSVTDVTDKTVDNVNSDDKAGLDAVKETVDNLLTNYSGNLTAEEKAKLTAAKDKVDPLVEKIAEIKQDIADLENENSKYTPDTVTSDDKAGIENAIKDAEALLNGNNLTDAEREHVQEILDNLNACLDRIEEVKNAIGALDTATDGKTVSTVTSDDKKAIEDALNDVNSILDTNLTATEKEALASKKENAEALLNKIEETSKSIADINSSISGITADNVTSDNKTTIETAISNIDTLLDGTNLTAAERAVLEETKKTLNSYLNKIEEVKNCIEEVNGSTTGLTTDNVTSDNKTALEEAKAKAEELLAGENLTAAEREALTTKRLEIQSLLDKIADVNETLDVINGSTTGLTTDNVTSDNKTSLENAKAEAEDLLNGTNLTAAEREALETKEAEIEELLSQIKTTSDAIASIDSAIDGITTDNVNSDNKAALEEAKKKAEELLAGDNLTSEERESLTTKRLEIQSLLDKIADVSETLDVINGSTTGLTTDTVTSDSKTSLENAKAEAEELLKGTNLTTAEREALTSKEAEIEGLLSKIKDTSDSIDSINTSIDGITADNVNSDNKTTIETAIGNIDTLLDGTNLTAAERAELEETKSALNSYLNKIEDVKTEIDGIDSAIDGITESNVTSDNKTALEGALDDINGLLDGNNLNASERTDLESKKAEVEKLIGKIESVKGTIDSVNGSTTGLTTDNVTSDSKASLEEAKANAEALLNGTNLTAAEREALTSKEAEIEELLSQIKTTADAIKDIDTAVDGITTDNVTSDNKTALEGALEDIDDLLNGTNLTAEERTALEAKKANVESLLAKIDNVAESIKDVSGSTTGITTDNVNSDNKAALEEAKAKAEELLNGSNLTAEERTALTTKEAEIDSLLNKIKTTSDAISKIDSSISGITEGNVTSDNKTALNEAIGDIDELLNGTNLTAEERTALEAKKADIESLLAKIDNVAESIKDVSGSTTGITTDNVTSDNKTSLEEAQKEAEDLLASDNLTAAEKEAITSKKAEIDSLLDKIDDVSGKIDSVNGSTTGLTTDNVTSGSKTSLEDAKSTVESLLNGTNLTTAEREALTSKQTEIQTLLDKIESTNDSIGAIDTAIDGITEDNVTSNDKATLEKTLEDIEELLNGSNLTDEEKEELIKKKNRIHVLMAKVNKVQEDIDAITDASTSKTTDNVTSDNKAALEDAKAKAEELLNGSNLTDEERAALTTAKTNVDTLLSKISSVNTDYEDVKTALTEYEKGGDLDTLVSKAEELKNSGNLTEEEKAELTKLINQATNIETAKKSLWWLVLVALGCLTIIGGIAFLIIRKKEDKEEKENQKK